MSDLTNTPIGFYPEDKARVRRILAAMPDLKNVSSIVRFALKELDERLAKRQRSDASASTAQGVTVVPTAVSQEVALMPATPAPAGGSAPAVATTARSHAAKEDPSMAKLLAAIGGRSHRAVDQLAGVTRGTTRNVLRGSTMLSKAGGGRLLAWAIKEAAQKGGA